VEDPLNPGTGFPTIHEPGNISFSETKPAPLICCDVRTHIVEIVAVAGGQINQANDVLIERETQLHQMRTDVSRSSSDQPLFWGLLEIQFQCLKCRGHGGNFSR
jgi:hypothetical protein